MRQTLRKSRGRGRCQLSQTDGVGKGILEVLPIPSLTAQQLADPIREAARWRIPLLNQVAVLGSNAGAARKRAVLGACQFLTRQQQSLLDVARQDHSIEDIKKVVQLCRLYKARYLQLHLTDDQGWTFPSTKYPKLGTKNVAAHGGKTPRVYPLDEAPAEFPTPDRLDGDNP